MSLSPETRSKLKVLYNTLNDAVVEPGNRAYVAEINKSPRYDPIGQIASEIDFQEGGGVCLFTGQRGTGKSTELKRLQHLLQTEFGHVVLYADMAQYTLLTKPVEITDFLIVVAGALSEEIERRYGSHPGDRSYWERIRHFLNSELRIEEATLGVSGMEFKAAIQQDPDFKQRIQQHMRGHAARIIGDAHAYIREAVQFVRTRNGAADTKVVLLIDSIERIRGMGDEAMLVYESVRNLFLGYAEQLKVPPLHIVYTVPPYLSVLAAGAGTLMGGAITHRLVSTHIFKDRSREPDPEGLRLMREILNRRYPEWGQIFTTEALDQLALSSGGDLRQFFSMIRACLSAVQEDGDLPLSDGIVERVENFARGEMLPIPRDHLQWLHRIAESKDTCLERDDDLPTLAHFLDNRLLMNYRNGKDWYDVHPLLREVVDAYADHAEG